MQKRTFSILGDSISTFRGYNPHGYEIFYPFEGFDVLSVKETWWSLLSARLNLTLIINESWAGSRISRTGSRPATSCFADEKRQQHLGGDLIIVFGGTNDYGAEEDPPTRALFAKAYRDLVESMGERHGASTLYFCTPLQRTDHSLTAPNAQGWTQVDLAQTIRDIVGEYPFAHLIDLALYPIAAGDGFLTDGLHPSKRGMETLASLMEAAL